MTRLPSYLFFAVAALWLQMAGAQAATLYLKARLDGAQAGVATSADGAGLVSYDTVSRSLSWTITYRNFMSALTGAHLHGPAEPGAQGAIVVTMAPIPAPVGSPPFSGLLTGNATITPEQEADLLGGLWYVDLHTGTYPAGEIRGQLAQIDTNFYSVSYGIPAVSTRYISGTVAMDMATLQMSWNIGWGVVLHSTATSRDFHGPATGTEYAPVTVPASCCSGGGGNSGSATLTAAQAAELVNGFWYFQVDDINGWFRAYVLPVYPHLYNISTRVEVSSGDEVAIAGFIIGGSSSKTVVIVGQGPSLAKYGVANPIANPKLTIVRQSDHAIIAENDDWTVNNPNSYYLSGYNSDTRESGLFLDLAPGAYTAILSNADGGAGVGLVAVYERNSPQAPFINMSTRGKVLQGDSVMIGGFVIAGNEPKTVVVRASGPSLAAYGVAGVLANPTLTLVRMSDQTTIATNDDWQSASNAADLVASGFAPTDALESAILIKLDPGAYTAIVAGQGGGTGIGTVEVYEVGRK